MRPFLFLAYLALTFTLQAGEVRVMTWNMKWFPGQKPEASALEMHDHMQEAQAVLCDLKPDILILEEIKMAEAAQELVSCLPGLNLQIVTNFPARGGQKATQQIAIASRINAVASYREEFIKVNDLDPPRGFAASAIELPDQRLLMVLGVHLKSNLPGPVDVQKLRAESARQLLVRIGALVTELEPRKNYGVLVGGDFNTAMEGDKFTSESTLKDIINAGYYWTHQSVPLEQRFTMAPEAKYEPACFDHIFTKGLGSPKASVPNTGDVSDHYPVVTTIELPGVSLPGYSPLLPKKDSGRVNLNTASKAALMEAGISATFIDQVIALRPYRSVSDLLRVKGIGVKTLEKVRPQVTVIGT